MICNKAFPSGIYRYHSIRAELRSWSDYGALSTQLDKYRVFFYTPNCISVSSLFTYRAVIHLPARNPREGVLQYRKKERAIPIIVF